MNYDKEKIRLLAPAVVRWGVSALLLWFGIQQLITPEWFYGFVPAYTPFSVETTILLNAVLELVLGTALAIGFFVRIAATITALHLFGISVSVGYNDVMARDVALALAATSIALNGTDTYCWRRK